MTMRRHLITLTLAAAAFAGVAACKDKKADTTPVANETGDGAATGTAAPADPPADPAGEGGTVTRPATVTDEMIAVMDKVVVAFEAMGADLRAAGDDCAKGAAAMRAHTPKLQAVAAEAKKFDAQTKDDEAAGKYFEQVYGERLMVSMGGMMDLSAKCSSDADFQKAAEDFGKALE